MDLPDKIYLRRSEVRLWLGVSENIFTKLVENGALRPVYATDGGRAHFLRAEVLSLAAQIHPTPTPTSTPTQTK